MSGTTFPLSVLADFSRESYAKGHAAGVQAARDAVAALPQEERSFGAVSIDRDAALAAINALREAPHVDPCDCDQCRRIGQVRRQPSLSDDADEGYDGQWHRDLYGGEP